MKRFASVLALSGITALAGCVAPTPRPNDPYYAPVLPRTPLPAEQNNGSIYQAGFENNLFDDRKAYRVGDIITITLNERTQASKNAGSQIQKDSSADIGGVGDHVRAFQNDRPKIGMGLFQLDRGTDIVRPCGLDIEGQLISKDNAREFRPALGRPYRRPRRHACLFQMPRGQTGG